MINENFVYLAIALNFIGGVGYLIDTWKGKTKPNRVTWLLWGVIPLIVFLAQLQKEVGLVSLMTLGIAILPFAIFFLTFVVRSGQWQLTKFDYVCGTLSLIGLALWAITREGNIAILFNIFADAAAALPTITKSFRAPETESSLAYSTAAIGAVITVLTIKSWNFATYAFPIYIFLLAGSIYLLVKFKLGRRLSNRS